MHYCQSWEQRLWLWVLLIQEHLFLTHFLASSYIPLIWSYTHIWSHQISLLALVALPCFIFSPLHAFAVLPLLLTWLFLLPAWAHTCFSYFKHTKLPLVTHVSPSRAVCLSPVSIMKAQMDLLHGVSLFTVDLLNTLTRFLVLSSLPDAGMREHHLHSL